MEFKKPRGQTFKSAAPRIGVGLLNKGSGLFRSLFLAMASMLWSSMSEGQIRDLDYCGIHKASRNLHCYESINRCFFFTIANTCRAKRRYGVEQKAWCLYVDRAFLWGCYINGEVCKKKAKTSPRAECFPV